MNLQFLRRFSLDSAEFCMKWCHLIRRLRGASALRLKFSI